MYFKNSAWVILVYDVTTRYTFDLINFWINDINSSVSEGWVKILWGNKTDNYKKRVITTEEGIK